MSLPQQSLPADPAQVAAALFQHSGYPFLNLLRCSFGSGILVLTGSLPTNQLNDLATSLAARVEGVRIVVNRVEVAQRAPIRRNL